MTTAQPFPPRESRDSHPPVTPGMWEKSLGQKTLLRYNIFANVVGNGERGQEYYLSYIALKGKRAS